jgi:DAK2 domain fusion protein YloV
MKRINGQDFKKLLKSGMNALINNRLRIDSLNVFPVPDGDTGSNMSSTVEYAYKQIQNDNNYSIGEILTKFAKGMLLGARGNSGVILSQFFKGFSIYLKNKKTANAFDLVEALNLAKKYAYKTVYEPVEGTILTVIRLIYENLSKSITVSSTIEETLQLAHQYAFEATKYTPELLAVLKEVGVVDSGGEGLTIFIEGMYQALINKSIKLKKEKKINNNLIGEDYNGEFGYCTEFILSLLKPKSFKKNNFEKELLKLGKSLVAIKDNEIVKVHIHSLKPGEVLTKSIKYGEFKNIKIDNMTIQANESNYSKEKKENGNKSKDIVVISCNTGQGIIKEMKELGASFIIEAGQTSNPSAKDFIESMNKILANKIIILPNNKNIILAAQQAAQTSSKDVIVIPTKTQMEGISAMLNFDSKNSLEDNREEMEEAITSVKTGEVTKATKSIKINGVNVEENKYLAIAEGKIINSYSSKTLAAIETSKKLIDENTEIVTIYYGNNATEIDANEIASYIETHYDVEIEIKYGDQKVYNFLISYE